MRLRVEADIFIEAPPERVWEVLADLPSYGSWNPFVPKVRGELAEGQTVTLTVLLGGKVRRQKLAVREVVPPSRLRWTVVGVPGFLLRGGRTQTLDITDGGTTYRNVEQLDGLLSPLVGWLTGKHIQHGLDTSCAALKHYVEAP